MKTISVKAVKREEYGKKAAKAVRREGMVPCVLSGHGESVAFSVDPREIKPLIYTPNSYIVEFDFDGKKVEYDVTELDELTLAYATTIHKAQGSEYPIVVMPVLMTHFVMLQRNLIYTGITRAKKICVLIGATKALAYAVHNMSVLKRNTSLRERLNPSLTTDGKLRG